MKLMSRIAVLIVLTAFIPVNAPARGTDEALSGAGGVPEASGVPAASGVPQRIVQAGPAAFIVQDALYMFPEAVEKVVALSDGNQGNGALVNFIDGDITGKTILPRKANTESIAALRPDTVVLKNFLKKSMGDALEKMGLPVFYVDLESPEAWMTDIERLGALYGNSRRAEEIKSHFQKRLAAVKGALADLTEEDKPRVLFLYWSVRDGVSAVNVPPENWMETRLVQMAGGVPVWTDGPLDKRWTRVNLEQIAAWNPDEIIVAAYHIPAEDALSAIHEDPAWAQIDAVKNGRLRAMPSDFHSWDQPGASWILGLQWLALTWHEERFPNVDMREELVNFYQDFFFQDRSFVEENVLSRLNGLD